VYFTDHTVSDRSRDDGRPPGSAGERLRRGWVRIEPIVYEDFLPRSAAGILQSGRSGEGSGDNDQECAADDGDWLCGAIGRDVLDPSPATSGSGRTPLPRWPGSWTSGDTLS
jgi:uncharacterized glyoxalase superfamily metalloenzyme YdcJ